jgi:hypothetical protein
VNMGNLMDRGMAGPRGCGVTMDDAPAIERAQVSQASESTMNHIHGTAVFPLA